MMVKKIVFLIGLSLASVNAFAHGNSEMTSDPCDNYSDTFVNIVNYSSHSITIKEVDGGVENPGLNNYNDGLPVYTLLHQGVWQQYASAGDPSGWANIYIKETSDGNETKVMYAEEQTVLSGQTYIAVFCRVPCASLQIEGPNAIYNVMSLIGDANATASTSYCSSVGGVNPGANMRAQQGAFQLPSSYLSSLINTQTAFSSVSVFVGVFGGASDAGWYPQSTNTGRSLNRTGGGPTTLPNAMGVDEWWHNGWSSGSSNKYKAIDYQDYPGYYILNDASLQYTIWVDDSWFNNTAPTGFQ